MNYMNEGLLGRARSALVVPRLARSITIAALGLLLVAGGFTLMDHRSETSVTVYFNSATGLYENDDVRVLGVKVGRVTSVSPDGDQVRVEISVDSSTPIPKGAKAAIVAPSLVTGRFVQLAPAWRSGPRLHDGAIIPKARTAVPISFDEVKKEITDLATALGPKSDTPGTLRDAITTIDANLANGNDGELRSAVTQLRSAAEALSDRRSDLFQTVSNLNTFTKNLATNDAAVSAFTTRLSDVTGYLNANRRDLGDTITELSRLTRTLDEFLARHGGQITTSVSKSATLASTLAERADELATILHIAPHAIDNLYNTVDDGAITGRLALANLDSVASLVCGALLSVGAGESDCQAALAPLLQAAGITAVPGSAASDQLGANPSIPQTPSEVDPIPGIEELLNSLGGAAPSQRPRGTSNGSGLFGFLGLGGTK